MFLVISFVFLGRAHYLLANLGYQLNTEDDNIAFGDRFFVNTDSEYFLFPWLTRKHGQEVISLLEFSFVHAERDQFKDRSGSTVVGTASSWLRAFNGL